MLLKGYTKENFRSKCDSRIQTLQFSAHLDDDISDVLPYLNKVLKGVSRLIVFEIFKLLPKTNCRECGLQTCLVFATRLAEGAYGAESCPPLAAENKEKLTEVLGRFQVDEC